MTTIKATRLGLAGCLLWAAAPWADPVPTGPMADYHVHCNWGQISSEAACAALADRLGGVERPSREERLALVWSRNRLRGASSISRAEACSATEAIVAEHPDYADALFRLSRCAHMGLRQTGADDAVALLRRAAESEPDNYLVLRHLLRIAGQGGNAAGIDPGTLVTYRESLYAAAKARLDWRRAVLPEEAEPTRVWSELFDAAKASAAFSSCPPASARGRRRRRPRRWPGCGRCWSTTAARGRRSTTACTRRGSWATARAGTACARRCGRARRMRGRGATWRVRCRGRIPRPPPTSWAKGATRRAWNPASRGGTARRPCSIRPSVGICGHTRASRQSRQRGS